MTSKVYDINDIMKIIPHRYPFLLVDRISDVKPNESVIGIKNVTMNESFFQGHFPGHPIMPGVMIVEAMAQTAGILVGESDKEVNAEKKVVYFMSMEEVKFRKPVVPGDQIYMHVSLIKRRGNIWKFKGCAKVSDVTTTEAIFTAIIVDR